MDISIDLPTVVFTPINDAIQFALLIGLLSGMVTVIIDLMLTLRAQEPNWRFFLITSLSQISLFGVLFPFTAFVELGMNPVAETAEINGSILTMSVSLMLGLGFSKIVPVSKLFYWPASDGDFD